MPDVATPGPGAGTDCAAEAPVAATWDTRARAALRHERRLFVAAQPAGWLLAKGARRRSPDLCRVPGLGYVVSGAEVTREIMLDTARYTKTGGASAGVLMTQVMGPFALLNMDGEEHIVLRRRLQSLFTPRYVAEVTDRVLGGLVKGLRTDLAAGREVDIARFAHVFTGTMLCHMNGIQLEGEALERRALDLYETGAELAKLVPLRVRRLPEDKVRVGRALFAKLVEGTDECWRSGDEHTIPGRLREFGLTMEESRGVVGILMLAGTETTSTAIGRITALLCDTGQWARLHRHPELMESAIDEGLRIVTPVPAFTRTVAVEHELRGVRLKADSLLLGFLTNAVRDPRIIEDGEAFDIGRVLPRELRHLWFGAGPHFCLGFNMARRQLTVVLEAIAAGSAGELEVVERRPARGVLLPTYERLVVRRRPGGIQ